MQIVPKRRAASTNFVRGTQEEAFVIGISGQGLGPADYAEWQQDRNGWVEKWQRSATKP
ncbi:MAG: hypothetical protein AMXMBFR16_12090 [Candidatus Uhrbacteria bacterium]